MTAADPDRSRAKLLWARLGTEYVIGGVPTRREPFEEISAALRAAREEERERCAGIALACRTGGDMVQVAATIRSGAPAEPDRVREAERAVVTWARELVATLTVCRAEDCRDLDCLARPIGGLEVELARLAAARSAR